MLNLTTVALPNLIANDIVMVQPMSSMTGYVTYVQYTTGQAKGATAANTVLNNPFKLGDVDSTYTSQKVVETFGAAPSKVAWTPCVAGDVKAFKANGDEVTGITVAADGTLSGTLTDVRKVAYEYDNVVIPQNDIPSVKAEIKSIPLLAKARRIAVYYSQIAAFQAKNDYGFDLGDQLAEKAVGQLSYEIDTEVCELLIENAIDHTSASTGKELVWNKTIPYGVNKMEHYEGFAEVVEIGRQLIYDATKRFSPNYMLIASSVLPVLSMTKGFTAAPASNINGPYLAGTFNGLKVFVTPAMPVDKFVIGVNGSDMMSSAAVYAPYMAIIPTQLLQYADGGNSQGWSTMYDLKILNPDLIVKGEISHDAVVVETHPNED